MCFTPMLIKKNNENFQVPCNKCASCRQSRVDGWVFRLSYEEKICKTSNFLTLTYADEHVPINVNGLQTLYSKDIQDFMKRLRKRNQDKIKYFCAGEYGDQTKRPHYHIIMFNHQIETVQAAWQLGNVHYDPVTPATIAYTMKYIHKNVGKRGYYDDGRQKEFQLMSKGLGAGYATHAVQMFHAGLHENHYYLNSLQNDGKKIAIPRYLQSRIYDEYQLKDIKEKNIEIRNEKLVEELFKPEKLKRAKREAIKAANARMLIKSQSKKI